MSRWKLVTEYSVSEYKCGLKAGEKLRLKKEIHIRDANDQETGEVLKAGEIWVVLNGVAEKRPVLWLRQPDGKTHTWEDSPSVFEHFEKCE